MTLVLDAPSDQAVQPASAPAQPAGPALSGWDVLAVSLVLALWAALFLVRYDALPMQLWDESRNANNALEMARGGGRWLAPTYAGAVDHWNTKPPLLIWCMAGLLRLGLPTLFALRATSWAAAAATAVTAWAVLRFAVKDRLAAFVAAVLLLSAWSYVGEHGARTADYDALEALFVFWSALAVWRAVETGRAAWVVLAGAALGLGVLTKGVAALLVAPGLLACALSRPAAFGRLMKDARTWLGVGLFLLIAGGYYGLREAVDPGYLKAVAGNELGGRFMTVTENHHGSWHFYLTQLVLAAEPCAAFCLLGLLPLFGRDPARRCLVLALGLAAGSLLVVLSASRSKMAWYVTPIIPFMAAIAGLGLSDALGWLRTRKARSAPAARAAVVLVLMLGACLAVWKNQTDPERTFGELGGSRFGYGGFLEGVRLRGLGPRVTVLDAGFRNDAHLLTYDPMLQFYAELEARRGLQVRVVHTLAGVGPGQPVGSCDGALLQALGRARALRPLFAEHGCALVLVQVADPSRR